MKLTRLECAEILTDLSFRLSRFKVSQPGKLYNFRCPFCGDSKKSPNKARGYVYEVIDKNTLAYKCHNCGLSLSFEKFVKLLDEEYYQKLLYSKFGIKNQENENTKTNNSENYTKALKEEETRSKFELEQYCVSLKKLINSSPNHAAVRYVEQRKLPESSYDYLYYTDNIKKFATQFYPDFKKSCGEDARIILPFFMEDGESFSYLQARAITQSKVSYYSMFVVNKRSLKSRIYGLYKNPARYDRIFVVEGPIDSLFVPNAIAVGGSSLEEALDLFDEKRLIFVFDNEPENKEIMKKMRKIIAMKLNVVIWPEGLKKYGKDINDLVKSGFSPEEVVKILNENVYSGLEAELMYGRLYT